MFTGIIETLGTVTDLQKEAGNLHLHIASSISDELKIDQSVSHNGVCLTVVNVSPSVHTVTAIEETLQKTNLGELKVGDRINLERCMPANGRLDGHIVQGHVDQVARCLTVVPQNGSWLYTFQYQPEKDGNLTVEKGSVTINGISLTVVDSQADRFSVAIIPYTYQHTNIQYVNTGDTVNIEFDIIGKYIARIMALQH